MNNRIALLLKVKDVTASKFADMIGVQPSNISHILSGRNKPSLDFIVKVYETFPDISLEWLMFGRGSMFQFMNAQQGIITEQQQKTEIPEPAVTVDTHAVPDLFSQHLDDENEKIEPQVDQDHEELTVNKEDEDNEIESKHEVIESEKFIQEQISPANYVKSQPYDENENKKNIEKELPKISIMNVDLKIKPERIILVYPDDTFEIITEKKKSV